MTNGSDLVAQRQARTVEQLRLKNIHEQKLLNMQIGQKGGITTRAQYEMKMLHKEKLKMERDFEGLRIRAAKTIHWTDVLNKEKRREELRIQREDSNTERKKSTRGKIKMKSKRMAKLHHRYSKDLRKAQEESQQFVQNIEGRDKYEVLRELDDLFRPKSARTAQLIQLKQQRQQDLLEDIKHRPAGNAHSKKRYKELTLAEIDMTDIRDKIGERLQREKTLDLEDRENLVFSPLLDTGNCIPRIALDLSKINKPKKKKKQYMDIVDFASAIGKDKWPKKREEKEKEVTQVKEKKEKKITGIHLEEGDTIIDTTEIDDEEEDIEGDWRMKSPNDLDLSDPTLFNPDGSLRTVHTLPNAQVAFQEARKARYLRKRDSTLNKGLDFDLIFGRKEPDIAEGNESESESESEELRPGSARSPGNKGRRKSHKVDLSMTV